MLFRVLVLVVLACPAADADDFVWEQTYAEALLARVLEGVALSHGWPLSCTEARVVNRNCVADVMDIKIRVVAGFHKVETEGYTDSMRVAGRAFVDSSGATNVHIVEVAAEQMGLRIGQTENEYPLETIYNRAVALVAHEVAHHVLGHTAPDDTLSYPEVEKMADHFATYVLRHIGMDPVRIDDTACGEHGELAKRIVANNTLAAQDCLIVSAALLQFEERRERGDYPLWGQPPPPNIAVEADSLEWQHQKQFVELLDRCAFGAHGLLNALSTDNTKAREFLEQVFERMTETRQKVVTGDLLMYRTIKFRFETTDLEWEAEEARNKLRIAAQQKMADDVLLTEREKVALSQFAQSVEELAWFLKHH